MLAMLERRTGMRLSARRPLEAANVGARGNRGPTPVHRRALTGRASTRHPGWNGMCHVCGDAQPGRMAPGSVQSAGLGVTAGHRELLARAQQPLRLPGALGAGILIGQLGGAMGDDRGDRPGAGQREGEVAGERPRAGCRPSCAGPAERPAARRIRRDSATPGWCASRPGSGARHPRRCAGPRYAARRAATGHRAGCSRAIRTRGRPGPRDHPARPAAGPVRRPRGPSCGTPRPGGPAPSHGRDPSRSRDPGRRGWLPRSRGTGRPDDGIGESWIQGRTCCELYGERPDAGTGPVAHRTAPRPVPSGA